MALLPGPKGRDEGHEAVEIGNSTDKPVDLAGWKLRDRAGNAYRLTGTVAAKGRLRIVMNPPTMPLNNDGDEVVLLDAAGVAVSRATYTEHQVLAKSWNLRRKGGRTPTPRIAAAVAEIHNGARQDSLKMAHRRVSQPTAGK